MAHAIAAGRNCACLYPRNDEPLRRYWFKPNRECVSGLPDVEGDKPKRQKFKPDPIGFYHIYIAEVQTAEGKLLSFVGVDHTSKFAGTQLVDKADRKTARAFLQHMLEAVPYQVHTVLMDRYMGAPPVRGHG